MHFAMNSPLWREDFESSQTPDFLARSIPHPLRVGDARVGETWGGGRRGGGGGGGCRGGEGGLVGVVGRLLEAQSEKREEEERSHTP